MLRFHLISIFPDTVRSYCDSSILGRAQDKKLIGINYYNPMDYTAPRTPGALPRRVDDKPYAGGPGMVMRAEPIIQAVEAAIGRKRNVGFIHFKPRSEPFTTDMAQTIMKESRLRKGAIKDIVIICGRYEGIDSRIEEIFPGRTLSVGDYVLTGGEIPAMIVIDTVSRQLPGVLGDYESLEEGRDAPGWYYTRPERIYHRGHSYSVPEVLVSGNHANIKEWRKNNQG